jgi:hypothetical protein
MTTEDFDLGDSVRCLAPADNIFHGVTGKVCGYDGPDMVEVRFDVYKPVFDQFEDTRTGSAFFMLDDIEKI